MMLFPCKQLEVVNLNLCLLLFLDAEPIILEEDSTFAGFVPLLEAMHNPAFAIQPFDKVHITL